MANVCSSSVWFWSGQFTQHTTQLVSERVLGCHLSNQLQPIGMLELIFYAKTHTHTKPEEWVSCLPDELKNSDRENKQILADFEQNQNVWWHMFIDDERWLLQTEEANDICLKAGTRLKSWCIPPVNTAPHGGQIESWWGGRWGLNLSTEPCIAVCLVWQNMFVGPTHQPNTNVAIVINVFLM